MNIIGLELLDIVGSPPESDRAVVDFQTGSSVGSGPASVRFTGPALLPATALGLGTEFASITNLQISAVPEPSVAGMLGLGAVALVRRREVRRR